MAKATVFSQSAAFFKFLTCRIQRSFHCGSAPQFRHAGRSQWYSTKSKDHKTVEQSDKKKLWLLVIPATTFCLGTWQVFRLQWKLKLVEELEKKTRQAPVDLPNDIAERLPEMEYRRVRLRGQFDHSRELWMWPRMLNSRMGSSGGKNEPGAHIITPFHCEETGGQVLVNRGWVPKSRMNPETRLQGQVEGHVTLTAVVRASEKRPLFSPANDPEHNHWSYKDLETMAKVAGTEPVLLDADAFTTVPGGPIGGQTRVTLRNEHLQYIFTWYALTLATGYLFSIFWKKTKRR
ncbi:hypothetical protein EMCRGX_G020173 [Ephydatia muelleri]|eukprot:Em0016g110a